MKAQDSDSFGLMVGRPPLAGQTTASWTSTTAGNPTCLDLNTIAAINGNDCLESSFTLLQTALLLAHQKSAYCVYIEPEETVTRLRFRIPGALLEERIENGEQPFHASSAITQLTGQAVPDKGLPAEINLSVRIERQEYDIRIFPLPGDSGQMLTIKLRKKLRFAPTLDELDIPRFTLKQLRDIIRGGPGLILITGPAGSHKKLSLYAILQDLNAPSRKIISLEKSIQYPLPRISQVRLPESSANTEEFARYILEQAADVLCLDNIRNGVLFNKLLIEALNSVSLLSSIDARSALEGVRKLQASGIDSFALSCSLSAILTQQALRTVCEHCRVVHKLTDPERRWVDNNFPGRLPVNGSFSEGEGCQHCANTGFGEEIRIYELIRSDTDIANAILQKDIAALGTAVALRNNFETLKQRAFDLACKGKVPLSQAMLVD
ncbi:MAG: Flp pilus assembly complex ATPase component TadA [Gammaproteobacteria bacterium]|nr:Flp pilus assembly complex ATPase component TadA [Gammaproteobacteria bacterium]